MEGDNNNECPVCFQIESLISNKYECIHSFCQECYDNWHLKSNKCPMCRSEEVNNHEEQTQDENETSDSETSYSDASNDSDSDDEENARISNESNLYSSDDENNARIANALRLIELHTARNEMDQVLAIRVREGIIENTLNFSRMFNRQIPVVNNNVSNNFRGFRFGVSMSPD
jgi:hypothetical protein